MVVLGVLAPPSCLLLEPKMQPSSSDSVEQMDVLRKQAMIESTVQLVLTRRLEPDMVSHYLERSGMSVLLAEVRSLLGGGALGDGFGASA